MARVELTDDAKDDLRNLDGSVTARVLKDLKKLESNPALRGEPLGVRKTGDLTGFRKLYVGPKKGYRAVFAADGDTLAVVLVIAEREDQLCYEMAVARIQLIASDAQRADVAKLLDQVRP